MSLELSTEKQGGDHVEDEKQVVIFKLNDEEFGVAIEEVREINKVVDITKIPNTPVYIKGIINLRGQVIVVIDLSTKLGLPQKEYGKDTRIIVIEVGSTITGMIVDSATEVLRLKNNEMKSAPDAITKKIDADYIEGVGIIDQRLLILLNLAKVLDAKEVQSVVMATKDLDVTDVEDASVDLVEDKPLEKAASDKPKDAAVAKEVSPKVKEEKVAEKKVSSEKK